MEKNNLPYLSETIELEKIKKGVFTVIVAPCGAGKTKAAMEKIVPLAKERNRVIFLIDTAAGKTLC